MANAYLEQYISFGGELMQRGEVIATMQREGHKQLHIDRYMQGLDSRVGIIKPTCYWCGRPIHGKPITVDDGMGRELAEHFDETLFCTVNCRRDTIAFKDDLPEYLRENPV